ncbi:MAG: hypothetical protein EXR36_03945 [Betaproteobacteria bacterium]|nr:hypothetical protein [Betaproteobacteria bacterium]
MRIIRLITYAGIVFSVAGCDGLDSDFYPYRMNGLNAYAYNLDSGESFFAGFIEANYFKREAALVQCADAAS